MINNEILELEQEILGAFLNNQNLLKLNKDKIKIKHFQLKTHQNIYSNMLKMDNDNFAIDLLSFLNFNKDKINEMDSVSYISDIFACMPSTIGFNSKLDIFIDNYKTSLIKAITKDIESVSDNVQLTEILENTLKEVYETSTGKEIDLETSYEEYLDWLHSDEETRGFKSGLYNLDNMLGKFKPGRLITIFARSGVGKSTVAIQIALNMVLQKHKVIYGSGEMSKAEVINKMVASKYSIPYELISEKRITQDDKEKITMLVGALANNCFHISTTTNLDKLLTEAKAYKLKYGLDVIYIDYVNKYINGAKGDKLTEKIGAITSRLKDFALDENVCVVLLAQANRESDKKVGDVTEKISESDIQDSARIEQDSDQVLALYRNKKLDNAEYRAVNQENIDYNSKSAEKNPNCINITVVKNRHGKKGTMAFRWNGQYSQVTNFSN